VKEITGEGHTILLSSHILGQVEHLADTLTIINSGKTVESGSIEDLRKLSHETSDPDQPASLEQLFLQVYEPK
jgi:ABC-2 type transport system ATP-binding protein